MPTALSPQQPVCHSVPNWTARPRPPREHIAGHYCRLEPLDAARHGAELHAAFSQTPDGRDWTYNYVGPFPEEASYLASARTAQATEDHPHQAPTALARGRAPTTLASPRKVGRAPSRGEEWQ